MTWQPAADGAVVAVDGREIRVSNPDRVLWPESGTTKRDLIDYLLAVAPVLLPHLRRRPSMLWRFPEGVDGPGWFQANCRGRPDWVPTHEIVGRRGAPLRYCVLEERAALVWLANLGTIELHPFPWTIDRPDEPSWLVLDLDPGPPAGLVAAAQVAILLRDRLEGRGLASVVKTSGSLGLHVLAPLGAGHRFADTKRFARALAREVAAAAPSLVVESSSRGLRAGRVFVDWVQNDGNRQLVAPYSLRATPVPRVSLPVRWDEVEAVAASGDAGPLRFGPRDAIDRVARFGDLFAPALAGSGRLSG